MYLKESGGTGMGIPREAAHPQKWREICDPFSLEYRWFQLREVIGYPHASNDVFHVRGIADRERVHGLRQGGASKGHRDCQ